MAKCTAPIKGHRTKQGKENCPVCRYKYNLYNTYSAHASYPSIPRSTSTRQTTQSKTTAKWSPAGSGIMYTPEEIRTLTPVRESIVRRSNLPDLRDVFLCHAWDDRRTTAKELYDLLNAKGTTVWFSENDVPLGSNLLREIDKGLAKSRVGIVLVTPSFLKRVAGEGIADKELSALLARDLLIPIVYNTTFENLRNVSPLLGSRSGLNANEYSMKNIADKISELVTV